MSELTVALGMAAPFYNLAMVVVVIWLFVKLFRTPSSTSFMKPWYLLAGCIGIFVVEEVFTILRAAGLKAIPPHINGFFEFAIIVIFIYMVLIQKQYVQENYY